MEDGHFIDDPLHVGSVKPDFSGIGLSKKLENAILIGGRVYELIDDREADACQRCALLWACNKLDAAICLLFEDVSTKRFEEKK